METHTAEVWVKVFAILEWIGAGAAVLFGLIMFFGGAALSSLFTGEAAGLFAALGAVLGVIFIGLAVLCFFIGRGLWMHQNWARIVILVFAWLGGIGAVIGVIAAPFSSVVVGGIFQNLVSLIIAAFEIWLFQFNPAVKGLFGAQAKAA